MIVAARLTGARWRQQAGKRLVVHEDAPACRLTASPNSCRSASRASPGRRPPPQNDRQAARSAREGGTARSPRHNRRRVEAPSKRECHGERRVEAATTRYSKNRPARPERSRLARQANRPGRMDCPIHHGAKQRSWGLYSMASSGGWAGRLSMAVRLAGPARSAGVVSALSWFPNRIWWFSLQPGCRGT